VAVGVQVFRACFGGKQLFFSAIRVSRSQVTVVFDDKKGQVIAKRVGESRKFERKQVAEACCFLGFRRTPKSIPVSSVMQAPPLKLKSGTVKITP
jgi:hypothetical protein